MSAREVIAHTIPGTSAELCFGLADAIVERLSTAGYHILAPGDENRFGKEWYERTFGVPLGDTPGRLDVERVLRSAGGGK